MSNDVAKMIIQIAVVLFVLLVSAYLIVTGHEIPAVLLSIIQTVVSTYFVVQSTNNLYKEPPK